MNGLSRWPLLVVIALAVLIGFNISVSSPSYAATFNGARNGLYNNSGYVELGGTLRRKTVINTNGYWIGIGTSSPRRTLHLNSGNNNSPFELQSTDPYALMAFSDDTTDPVNALWIGALGDELVLGQAANSWAHFSNLGLNHTTKLSSKSLAHSGLLKTKLTDLRKASLNGVTSPSINTGLLEVGYGSFLELGAVYMNTFSLYVLPDDISGYGEIRLNPYGSSDPVYNDLDMLGGAPDSGHCSATVGYEYTIGRMIYDSLSNSIWVCGADGTWRSVVLSAPGP